MYFKRILLCGFMVYLVLPAMINAQPGFEEQPLLWQDFRNGPSNRWETIRIWKLTEFLELNEEQAGQFFPALREYHAQVRKVDSTRFSLQREIMEEINGKKINQEYVNQRKEKLIQLQRERIRHEEEFLGSLSEYITPDQQARYLVFERRFQQELRNVLNRRGLMQRNNTK